MPYDDITKKPVGEISNPDAALTHLRQSLPGVCVAIRAEPNVSATQCGSINTGDVITVSGAEFDAHDLKWFKVVHPVSGYCISRHHMAKQYREDESLFVVVSTPPPASIFIPTATVVTPGPIISSSASTVEASHLRHSIPNVGIAIREDTSTSSRELGTINPGDCIQVNGDEILVETNGVTTYWYNILSPISGYCISRHPTLPGDGTIFQPVVPGDVDGGEDATPPSASKRKGDTTTQKKSVVQTKLRHVLPNVSIALRAETSIKSKKLGAINTGDIITVAGDAFTVDTNDGDINTSWYKVVHPGSGFCISTHPFAQALRPDGKIFIPVEEESAVTGSDTSTYEGEVIDKVMRLTVPQAVVNVRHQPSMGSRVVGSIKSGEIIKADRFIQGINGMDWYRLVFPAKGGYCIVNQPFTGGDMFVPCAVGDGTGSNEWESPTSCDPQSVPPDYNFPPFPEGDSGLRKVLFIDGVEIRIRASPSFSAAIIGGVAYNGEVVVAAARVVSVGGTDTEWYQITYPSRGYVISRHRCAYQKGYDTDNLFIDVSLPRPSPGARTVQGIAITQDPITQDQPLVVGDVVQERTLPPFAQGSAAYQ